MLRSFVKRCIPTLDSSLHKGQCGRIAVLGGSEIYVGAPYYAGIAALHCGADLLYLFTAKEAAPAIKCYSPELMVEPVYSCLDAHQMFQSKSVVSKLSRLHAICIGPGLGRHKHVFEGVKEIIHEACKLDLPIIIDADGLFFINDNLEIISGNHKVVLTPNIMEFRRLCKALKIEEPESNTNFDDLSLKVKRVADMLGNVNILLKGKIDIISNGNFTEEVSELGGLRRSGGKGDVLAGLVTLACGWASIADTNGAYQKFTDYKFGSTDLEAEDDDELGSEKYMPFMWACIFASTAVKQADRMAFNHKGRAMTTPDIFPFLGKVIEQFCPSPKI